MKYTEEVLRSAAAEASSIRHVIRIATGNDKPSGGTANHVAALLKKYNIDTSHFTGPGWRKGNRYPEETGDLTRHFKRLDAGSPRIKGTALARAMVSIGVPYECAISGTKTWMGQAVTLQVDHIDGDWYNNERDNLRFLCPNCHTQTSTWGKKRRL